ncbi:uncharacterized protein natalisin [Eurosta solidaginis]|uniref:uncharacterized protein natalisin n=1 Tax=Eurosta solidaginis TaxID=178769 RepID=UPI003530FE49
MRITLSVLLATLTIYYSNSSVLSLPPSLITTAASSKKHHHHQASQIRYKRGLVDAGAAKAGTDHLLQQLNSPLTDPPLPPPHERETVRSKKEARFRIATNGYTDKNTDTNSDDITRLPDFALNSNAGIQMTHPNEINTGILAAVEDVHERHGGSSDFDHLNEIAEYKRKLPSASYLNALLANGAQQLQPTIMRAIDATQPHMHAMLMKKFFTPLKYWTHHCRPLDRNCLQEYYRTLHADRSKAAAAAAQQMYTFSDGAVAVETDEDSSNIDDDDVNMNAHVFAYGGGDHNDDGDGGGGPFGNFNDDAAIDSIYNNADIANIDDVVGSGGAFDNEDNNASNDILVLLSGEQDVMKFLSWAMRHLYPYQHFANLSGGSAEYYHPGMYNWKKLNLSGRLEPPILVEEPHYVIVRREPLDEDMKTDTQYKGDPFIPPRGRKHNLPNLDALLNRYETFVPNRGKRDKIKDIFKYDDLFFPNRGKKQRPLRASMTRAVFKSIERQRNCGVGAEKACGDRDGYGVEESIDNEVDENDDSELTVPPAAIAMRHMFIALKQRLHAPHKPYKSLGGRSDELNSNKGEATEFGINFDSNSDDNLSNNYSDTIDDSNLVGDGRSWHEDDKGFDDNDNAAVWIPDNDAASAIMLTRRPTTNSNDQSVKSSIPQIAATITTLNENNIDPMMTHMRRVPSTYVGAVRVAANRLRLTPTVSKLHRQHKQRAALQQLLHNQHEHIKQKQRREEQKLNGILRYNDHYMKRATLQQAKRIVISPPQVRADSNDLLDLLPLRQLQQLQQQK